MDTLDSRSLRYTDCYAQKFSDSGTIHYRITTAAGSCLPVERSSAFTIEVIAKNGDSDREELQHNVTVRRKGNSLVPDTLQLNIEVGDTVLWHTSDPTLIGFTVYGEGDCGSFNSSELSHEAVYTHAFGSPGEYHWVDANCGQVSGLVIVRSPDNKEPEQCRKWISALGDGALVLITGDCVEPQHVEILTGQTVFWAVQKADRISITDVRLVKQQPA